MKGDGEPRPTFMIKNAKIARILGHNIWIHTVNDWSSDDLNIINRRDGLEQLNYVLSGRNEISVCNFKTGHHGFDFSRGNTYIKVDIIFYGYPSAYLSDGDCFSVTGKDGYKHTSEEFCNKIIPCDESDEGWFDTRVEGNKALFVMCSIDGHDENTEEYLNKISKIAKEHGVKCYIVEHDNAECFIRNVNNIIKGRMEKYIF